MYLHGIRKKPVDRFLEVTASLLSGVRAAGVNPLRNTVAECYCRVLKKETRSNVDECI